MEGDRSLAERPPSSSIKPFEAKPEAIPAPPKGDDAGADSTPPDRALASVTDEADQNATFANTKQHVADRQKAFVTTEQRFAHTKQNIALINDPKNGPRFTLTKKESGHIDTPDAEPTPSAKNESIPDPTSESEAANKLENEAEGKAAEAGVAPELGPEPVGHENIDWLTDSAEQEIPASTANEPIGPLGVPPAAKPPDKVPIDSSKTFVGPNGTFYDEAWRWMDWRGAKRSWNWSAALSFGHWFAYRRLYGHAGAYVVWLVCLAAALVNNLHVGVVAGLLILSLILVGFYTNTLYLLVFKNAVAEVTENGEGSYDDLRQQLADAGGVNPNAPWYMAGLTVMGIGMALAATFFVRDAFLINIWPF